MEIALPGYSVWLQAWHVQVGRVKLHLLDNNDAANFPAHRGITSDLYGGGPELRLKQELLLWIGGWRLLMPVLEVWKATPPVDFPNYAADTCGPEATQGLLVQQGHRWPLPAALTQSGRNVRGAGPSKRIK